MFDSLLYIGVNALYFRGYNTFEYAISHTELATYDDEDDAIGVSIVVFSNLMLENNL